MRSRRESFVRLASSIKSMSRKRTRSVRVEEGPPVLKSTIKHNISNLNPETIAIVNRISESVKQDMPGIVVEIGNHNIVHQALALPGSPLPQGANPAASAALFEAWLQSGANNVANANQA